MKKQIFKFTGIIAVGTVMVASFFVSGKVQSPSDGIVNTLQSIEADAFADGCENSGVCSLDGVHYPFAPV